MDTFLFGLTLFVLVSAPVAFMERLIKKQKDHNFPFSDKLSRPAGYSVGKKVDNLRLELFTHLFGSIVIAYITCIFLFLTNSLLLKIVAICLIFFEIYLLVRAKKILEDLNNHSLVYAGELAVGQSLSQLMLDGYHVFHDLPFQNYNIDHILVGKNGVFAIETKAKTKRRNNKGKKLFNVDYDGDALFFENNPLFPHRKFLEQASNQANSLEKELTSSTGDKVKVIPVLVLPGWQFNLKVDQNKVRVKLLNHNKLEALLRLKTNIQLNETEIKRIIHQLKQKCEDVDLNKGKWG